MRTISSASAFLLCSVAVPIFAGCGDGQEADLAGERVEYGKYDRSDGVSIPTVEIRVREMIMLGGRRPTPTGAYEAEMEL